MYSILLVDDEVPVRRMIQTSIDWEAYGFQIIDEAENGLEALEIIQEKNPDIVITDIKMPYMDGIDLIRRIRDSHPNTTVIIFSGYDEFTYAQTAIQLDVAYYALKPLSKDDFIDLLVRLKKHLDEKIESLTNHKKLEQAYNNAINDLKQQFLVELFEHTVTGLMSKAVSYELPYDQDMFITAVIETYDRGDKLDLGSVNEIINSTRKVGDNSFNAILKEHNLITYYSSVEDNKEDSESQFMKKTLNQIDNLRKNIEFYTKKECSIGVSRIVNNLADLPESRRQAICALNYKQYYPHYNLYYIGDLESEDLTLLSSQAMEEGMEQLVTEVKLGNETSIDQAVTELFNRKIGMETEQLRAFTFRLLATLSNLVLEYNIDITSNDDTWSSLSDIVFDINTIYTVSNRVHKLCILLNKEITQKRHKSNKKFVEEAKKLIELNYGDVNFTLNSISDKLGVSESYFSSAFKKECGITFVSALTNTRIDHAKSLLKKDHLKIYEIAQSVGFADANYFSFCFKKTTGTSPQTYRRKAYSA
ncbi:response regulator [Spirochaeta cellobiosiphila]|uniref:response regulator n=1 Tax=Spirochaeta cellobiosiphila TaxID=504483 RepID=UPI00048FCA06|nr:response regulator [Spirochaeta cellobiosiphila]